MNANAKKQDQRYVRLMRKLASKTRSLERAKQRDAKKLIMNFLTNAR